MSTDKTRDNARNKARDTTRDNAADDAGHVQSRGDRTRQRIAFSRRAATAAVLGVILSLIAAFAIGRWENSIAHVEFAGAATHQAAILQNGVNEYLARLVALKTLFESTDRQVTRGEFEVFIK
ncbi:MAG: hypothetical protein C5B56_01350, partial [Proteobacteria bacterium]